MIEKSWTPPRKVVFFYSYSYFLIIFHLFFFKCMFDMGQINAALKPVSMFYDSQRRDLTAGFKNSLMSLMPYFCRLAGK